MRSLKPHRTHFSLRRTSILAGLLALLIGAAPAAADQVSGLAEKLSALRGEVEQLSATLASKDAEVRDQLRALSRQKAELELELKREQTRIQKVQLSIKDRQTRISESQGHDAELEPLFGELLKDVRAYVRDSLPFRASERLAEIQKIEEQHKQGLLSTSKALSRLWTFVEDEFRLTRESGIYKQAVKVDGQEHLAEVARLGMVLLYFRVDDHLVGRAVRTKEGWTFESIDSMDQQKLVVQLFDAFKMQIRVGLFQLPASLETPQEGKTPPPAAAPLEKDEPATEDEEPAPDAKEPAAADSPEGTTPDGQQKPASANPSATNPAATKPAATNPTAKPSAGEGSQP